MAIAVHCNLRSSDVAPVIIGFYYVVIPSLKLVNLSVPDLQRFHCW